MPGRFAGAIDFAQTDAAGYGVFSLMSSFSSLPALK